MRVLYAVGTIFPLMIAACTGGVSPDEQLEDIQAIVAFRGQATPLTQDIDLDGIVDQEDNCPATRNADQQDIDNDGVGNLCDVSPQQPLRDGPPPKGTAVLEEFAQRIEAYQGEIDEDSADKVYVTVTRVCRGLNQGPFASEAEHLVAGLRTGDGYTTVDMPLNVAYPRLAFTVGSSRPANPAKATTFWDDHNQNSEIDAGETEYDFSKTSLGNRAGVSNENVRLLVARKAALSAVELPEDCDEYVSSPLLLDLGHDGFGAFSAPSVLFDLNADGDEDLVGWVTDTDDAMLALDQNGDGHINHGGELFGNNTRLGAGMATNGFEALAQYDDNGDQVIDENDAVFARLILWQDLNLDGLSQAGEMTSLAEYGVVSISVEYVHQGEVDEHGNATMQRAAFRYLDDGTNAVGRDLVIDVWFAILRGV